MCSCDVDEYDLSILPGQVSGLILCVGIAGCSLFRSYLPVYLSRYLG